MSEAEHVGVCVIFLEVFESINMLDSDSLNDMFKVKIGTTLSATQGSSYNNKKCFILG